MASGAGAYVQGCSLAQVQEASRAETSGGRCALELRNTVAETLGGPLRGDKLVAAGPLHGLPLALSGAQGHPSCGQVPA